MSPDSGLKLNLGCGRNHLPGWLNVDMEPSVEPDLTANLCVPWPWASDSVSEVLFNHSMEHMENWRLVWTELYRVCEAGAPVRIVAPHWRHDDWDGDPSHVFKVTPAFIASLSARTCHAWAKAKVANTPWALYLGIDFQTELTEFRLDPKYDALSGNPALRDLLSERNNVAKEIHAVLRAAKST